MFFRKKRYVAAFLAFLMAFNLLFFDFLARDAKAYDVGAATSYSNALVWDAEAMLATIDGEADNGLKLHGDYELGDDGAGAENYGLTDGGYAKALANGAKSGAQVTGSYFEFVAPDDGTFVVKEKVSKGKIAYIVDASGNELAKSDNSAGSASNYDTITLELSKGDTVYGYVAGSKAAIFLMEFIPVQVVRTWDAAAMLATIEGEADNGLKLYGSFELGDDGAGAESYGLADGGYAKALANGAKSGAQVTGAFFEFTASDNGTLVVKEKVSKGKIAYIVDASGNELVKSDNSAGSASNYDTVTLELSKGDTVYGYVAGSKAAIFQIQFVVGEKTVTPWSNVPTPSITDVTVNEDGNFEVTFDCEVDEYSGADSVEIIALVNGGEVGSVTVTNNVNKTVVLTPIKSGNYEFFAVARRAGEGEKCGSSVVYEDYVLALKKPVITWAANKGDGVVYLDWLNLDEADSYNLFFKESTANEYEVAMQNITNGDATLSLVAGMKYDFKVEAIRNSDGFVSTYELTGFEVLAEEKQEWNLAIVGSAQEARVNIDGVEYYLDVQDNHELVNEYRNVPALNETRSVSTAAVASGKVADSEDGVFLYYTRIDPKTENFKLTATMEVTDTSIVSDSQTAFGIMAADLLGVNYWGKPDYKHKYFNSISVLNYNSSISLRKVTGYTSSDTMSNEDSSRTIDRPKMNVASSMELGTKYTFSLEKNDSGYVAKCNDVELSHSDNIITAVQEDGSVIVGVVVARKIGVTITDVTFEKSVSEAGIVGEIVEEVIAPSFSIFSSGTCGADEYMLILTSNCDGTYTVHNPDGNSVFYIDAMADEVVRAWIDIEIGENVILTEFAPADGSAVITKEIKVDCKRFLTDNDVLYVSPEGSETGDGTLANPLNLSTAVKYARPGQTVYLLNGKYHATTIQRSVSGDEDAMINLVAEKVAENADDEGVFFDGPLTIVGSYWYVYGLYFKDSSGVSMQIAGNFNQIVRCTSDHASNTGIQISRSGSANNTAGRIGMLWPTGNLVINCTSFDSCDAKRNDADGFAAKLTVGEFNIFAGCIAYNNIDDGWDLYAKGTTGQIGQVFITNCVAYNNGWLTTDDINDEAYVFGEGNGFKLGGEDIPGGHTLADSIAYNNHGRGITSNSCPDIKIINCTSYGNQVKNNSYNVGLNTKASNVKDWLVMGLISINNPENLSQADLIPTSRHSSNNYIYNGSQSVNSDGEVADDSFFASVDFVNLVPSREANGNISMGDLFQVLNSESGACITRGFEDFEIISPTFDYEIIDGADSEVLFGDATEVSIKSSAELIKFEELIVDDQVINPSDYVLTEGSTIVTLNADFISKLALGEHMVTVVSTDGAAKTTINVVGELTQAPSEETTENTTDSAADGPSTQAPATTETDTAIVNTGDSANMMLYIFIMIMAAGVVVVMLNKKRNV